MDTHSTTEVTAEDSAPRDLSAASELWGDEDGTWYTSTGWVHWTQHPEVKKRVNRLISQRDEWPSSYYWLKAYLADHLPVERALTLGCGIGAQERGLENLGFSRDHLALDISEGAVEKAQELARQEGFSHLRYEVADLNAASFPAKHFDVVIGVSAIHHVEELERLFEQINHTLKDDGFLLMDEFVGPTQFQWRPEQVELANRALRMLPKAYRRSASMPGQIKDHVATPTIDEMNRVDPTESIRSEEIVPLVYQYFDIVEFKGYGGSLLHLILDDIVGNFHVDDPVADSLLRLLFEVEDQAIAGGLLSHDFAAIVARKRSLIRRKKHERISKGPDDGLVRDFWR